jgi:hypothetical protein
MKRDVPRWTRNHPGKNHGHAATGQRTMPYQLFVADSFARLRDFKPELAQFAVKA